MKEEDLIHLEELIDLLIVVDTPPKVEMKTQSQNAEVTTHDLEVKATPVSLERVKAERRKELKLQLNQADLVIFQVIIRLEVETILSIKNLIHHNQKLKSNL